MKRIQFDMTEEHAEILNTLVKDTNVSTKKELFNSSLALIQWALREIDDGRCIGSFNPDGSSPKELSMIIFGRKQREYIKQQTIRRDSELTAVG